MYCPYCGKENKGASQFCTGCGKKLTDETGMNQNAGIDAGILSEYAGIEVDQTVAVHKKRHGKLLVVIAVALVILLVLGAIFGRGVWKSHQWKEYYNLGSQYLTEENYEEAVVAFTNAIEIDEKKADAYIGRGDAYVGSAEVALKEEKKEEAVSFYEKAAKDYETAANLGDETAEEAVNSIETKIEEAQYLSDYLPVLRRYQEAEASNYYKDPTKDSSELEVNPNLYNNIKLYYTLKDINDDSIPELFISGYDEETFANHPFTPDPYYEIFDVYTVSNGKLIQPFDLLSMGYRYNYSMRKDNIIACFASTGAYNDHCEFYVFEKGDSSPKTIYYASHDGWDGDKYFAGPDLAHQDTEITEQDWKNLKNEYPMDTDIEWYRIDNLESLGIEE